MLFFIVVVVVVSILRTSLLHGRLLHHSCHQEKVVCTRMYVCMYVCMYVVLC